MPGMTHDAQWNIYALPALISFGLLAAETLYLGVALPETKGAVKITSDETGNEKSVRSSENEAEKIKRLNAVGRLHGCFLLFFSGVSREYFLRSTC